MCKSKHSSLPFPLEDVELRQVEAVREISEPFYTNNWLSIGAKEFSMRVKGVGSFYASNGDYIEFAPANKAAPHSLELYLNGSVYGAILHQRKILPLHGSSFVTGGRSVILCGESGAGKSSLTAAFCKEGAEFLTDDVTPLLFPGNIPHILPKSGHIKLWKHSLDQLSEDDRALARIRPDQEKFYLPVEKKNRKPFPLHNLFILTIDDVNEVDIKKLNGTAAFSAIFNEIYRLYYLCAMTDDEGRYLKKVASISSACNIYKVTRPQTISIHKMKTLLYVFLAQNQ